MGMLAGVRPDLNVFLASLSCFGEIRKDPNFRAGLCSYFSSFYIRRTEIVHFNCTLETLTDINIVSSRRVMLSAATKDD